MASKEKTQRTGIGKEIPVPKRGDFFSNRKKAAAPKKTLKDRRAAGTCQ